MNMKIFAPVSGRGICPRCQSRLSQVHGAHKPVRSLIIAPAHVTQVDHDVNQLAVRSLDLCDAWTIHDNTGDCRRGRAIAVLLPNFLVAVPKLVRQDNCDVAVVLGSSC